MRICLQLINKPIACLPHIICIVLVTNSTEFVICDGTVALFLDNRWMATMIAEKCKGDFDTYFFVIDNFIKNANAKGYNRHVATGAMQPSELATVSRARSSWVVAFGELSGTMEAACGIYEAW
jgi:hypothetical protein